MGRIFVFSASLLFTTSACAKLQHVPNPPRSLAELTPAETPEEREEQYRQHRFAAAEKTTTVTETDSSGATNVSSYQDLSLLEQDGSYYHMRDYLPVLQSAGVATDADNPVDYYDDINKQRPWLLGAAGALVLAPAMAVIVPRTDCGDSPSILDDDYDDTYPVYDACRDKAFRPVYLGVTGTFAASGVLAAIGKRRMKPARDAILETKAQATKERAAWAREWNRQLEQKLGVEETGAVQSTTE